MAYSESKDGSHLILFKGRLCRPLAVTLKINGNNLISDKEICRISKRVKMLQCTFDALKHFYSIGYSADFLLTPGLSSPCNRTGLSKD